MSRRAIPQSGCRRRRSCGVRPKHGSPEETAEPACAAPDRRLDPIEFREVRRRTAPEARDPERWALQRLASASARPDYALAARTALAYERIRYMPEARNWSGPEFRHMAAWCHEAGGVALGRLHSLAWEKDDAAHSEMESEVAIESVRRTGPVTARPRSLESPGLMTGLAGIGYGLLRAAAPLEVPSVLALAPPQVGG